MKSSRKPGAQPRNKNALKHGIYTQFIALADDTDMLGMSDESTKDELAQARVNFKTAMQERFSASDTKEKLSWDFACHYWLETIINLKIRTIEHKQVAVEVWDTFIDAIRAANDKQVIKR